MNRTILIPALLSTATLAACAVEDGPTVGDDAEEIIGGVPAPSRRLDAIGSLSRINPDGSFRQTCTGTLITPLSERCRTYVSPGRGSTAVESPFTQW